MFNKTTILTCGESLVGFREDSNAIYDTLSASQQASDSGLYVNDLSGVSFENISAAVTDDLTAAQYLDNVYESELLKLVHQFVNKSKQQYNSKELLARKSIVSGVASMNNLVTQNKRFVGYWIRPHMSDFMQTSIIQLGMQADTTQAILKIFLYETSQLEPVATFDYEISKEFSLVWRDITTFILKHQGNSTGTGQDWMVGYYENDPDNAQSWQLQGQALYMQFDCNCPGSPKSIYGKYMGIQPIEIPYSYLNWDAASSTYNIPIVDNVLDFAGTTTHGLLAKVNVTCDITEVLCSNISMFARPLQHAIASKILYDAYASNRINSIADSKRDQAKQFAVKYDGILNGYKTDQGFVKGLVDTLAVDFSALDSYCLPCMSGIMMGNMIR